MAWDELDLHAFLAKDVLPARLEGRTLNHDAVVEGGRALCCDRTEEGVHFTLSGPEAAPLEAVAHKAVARVVSDLAATAARPRALLAAVAAPPHMAAADLRALLAALGRTAERYGAPLVGGDLTAVPERLSIVVTAWGDAPADPPGRDRLRPGDVVALSGPVGGSRSGRHLAIAPRLALAWEAHAAGVRTMMDVSDGLALDLDRLARASNLAIELDAVPVHADVRASQPDERLAAALFDGEDHELLLGSAPEVMARLDVPLIGRVTRERGAGLWLRTPLVEHEPGADPTMTTASYVPFDRAAPRAFVHGRTR